MIIYDGLRNEKDLVLWQSDNKNPNSSNSCSHRWHIPESKKSPKVIFMQSVKEEYVERIFHSCRLCYLRNRRWGGSIYVLQMFFFVFFCFFFRPSKNMRQPFSGTAERIFMKLLLNDRGGNVVWNVVPPLGESRAAGWRMANVDLRNLRWLCCWIWQSPVRTIYAMTLAQSAQRLRYRIMSARLDLI